MDYKEIFYKDSVEKQIVIKSDDELVNITNNELDGENMELTESICEKDELVFGACSAAELKFTVSGIQSSMQGKWLNGEIELKNEDISANPYKLGRYKVHSDKPTADRTSRTVIAYDALYDVINADVADWYNTILPESDSRVRLRDFRDSFFNHFEIIQEDINLVNDDMWVEKTVEPSELSGAIVLNCICEINGCLGHINRNGRFKYIYLEPIASPEDISKSLYTSSTYEDYIVHSIDKLQIRQEEDDIGVIVGEGDNSYIIEDNFLVYGKSSAELGNIAGRILARIKGLAYRPFTVECIGNPCISVGAAVRVSSTYETINSYVLKRTLKGVQSLSDTYEAAGNEYRTSKVNSLQKQIIQLKGKSNILKRSIEETNNTITNVEQGLKNEISATAADFDVKIQDLQSEIDGEITVINGHGVPTLYNYPAYNWTAGPKVGDTLVEGLCFTYADDVYRKHQRTLFFDEDEAVTYRFIQKDGVWRWEPLANTEYSVLQKQIADLNVTAQGITQSVEQLSTKVTNEYITQIDAKTLVSTTADGVKEDISKVYSTQDYVNTLKASFDKTAEGLTAQISEVNEALDGANEAYTIRGKPTLYNYPAYNWTAGPVVGDKLTQGLRFTYMDESYRKHNRALVYDEDAGKTYRFVKSGDTWEFSDVGDTEFSWVNKKLAEYKATADGLSADLSKFETKVGSDYITKMESKASIDLSTDGLKTDFNKKLESYSTTEEMNTAIRVSAGSVLMTVSNNYATQGVVSRLETSVKATAEGLEAKVSKNNLVTEINASAEGVLISSSKLDLKGLVTVSDLAGSGKTVINADNIKTGIINSIKLYSCDIDGGAIAIGGNNIVMNTEGIWVVGDGSVTDPVFRVNNSGYMTAQSGKIGNWAIGEGAIANNGTVLGADGTLTIASGKIGNWAIGSGAIANNGVVLSGDGKLILAGDSNEIQLGSNAKLIPTALYVDQKTTTGTAVKGSVPWYAVFKAATNYLSDERIKSDVNPLSDAYDELFNKLQPYTFKFNDKSSIRDGKEHIGFIAQRIKENIDETGLSELALYVDDDPDLLGVDKQELITLCVWQIQKLKARVSELEKKGEVEYEQL